MNSFDIIENEFTNSGLIKNNLYYNRYIKLMSYYVSIGLTKDKNKKFTHERHHILPRKIWPAFEKEKWNIVILPARAHLLAHRLLYKCIAHSSCVYSFNQMRRVAMKFGYPTGKIYEIAREEVANLIRISNTGRKRSDDVKQRLSKAHSGTNIYRNTQTLELKRYGVNDVPEGWEPFQKGRRKSTASKQKLSEKMRERIWQFNPDTKDVKFSKELHDGYVVGVPPWMDNNAKIFSTYKWAFDPGTGDAVRCPETEIPDGYVVGRNYHNRGFEMINNSDLTLVLDVQLKKFTLINKSEVDPERHIKHGASIDDIYVFRYKSKTFYSWADMEAAFPELPKYHGSRKTLKILEYVVPKSHFNQTLARQEFCDLNHGKTFRELGISVTKLTEDNI